MAVDSLCRSTSLLQPSPNFSECEISSPTKRAKNRAESNASVASNNYKKLLEKYSLKEIKKLLAACDEAGIDFTQIVDSNSYIYPDDIRFSKAFGDKTSPIVSWKKTDPLPKALLILSSGFSSADSAHIKATIENLKNTYSIQVRHIDPKKTADELWHVLDINIRNVFLQLVVIVAHGSPKSMKITKAMGGWLRNTPNPLAASVLSRLPYNSDLVLYSCLTGFGGEQNRSNMANFFASHAPQARIHASELAVDRFSISSSDVQWEAPSSIELYESLKQHCSFRFPKTGKTMPVFEIAVRVLNSLIYFYRGSGHLKTTIAPKALQERVITERVTIPSFLRQLLLYPLRYWLDI